MFMTYKYERNECQGCSRICYCIVWVENGSSSILCDACFSAMKQAPDMKIVGCKESMIDMAYHNWSPIVIEI